MAGTSKSFSTTEIHQGPGDLWVISNVPDDETVRLTLASDGTPDATTHTACVHLGATTGAITTVVKPKIEAIGMDQADAPVGGYVTELDASIEAEMAQAEAAKAQRLLGVGTYSAGSGYKQMTFGGTQTVPKAAFAVISRTKESALRHVVSLLFSGAMVGGFQSSMGRAKASASKLKIQGLTDTGRTAGQQIGVIYKTLADAAGGTPTAKDLAVSEIQQGPADLWLIGTAPTNAAVRLTLAADLTPDATAHPSSLHLGGTEGPINFSVSPKIEMIRMDQFDGPVDVAVTALEAKIEAELSQSAAAKLAVALGLETAGSDAGYEQLTFGGTNVPQSLCVAAIQPKRSDATKVVAVVLYSVLTQDGITIEASRAKKSTYKATFTGLADLSRTAGKQIGVWYETA